METKMIDLGLTEKEKANVANWFENVYSTFKDDQKKAYDTTLGAWGFVSCAKEAYDCVSDPRLTDGQKIFQCGQWASMALAAVGRVGVLWNSDTNYTLKKMDDLCAWVRKNGGHVFLPKPVDKNGTIREKTISGTYEDMKRYVKTLDDYKARLASERAAKEK